jgi:molybdopterin converting factor small subunit
MQKRKDKLDPLNDMNKLISQKKKVEATKKEDDKKSKQKKTIDDLRAERLQREQAERDKVNQILNKTNNNRRSSYNTSNNRDTRMRGDY